MKKEKIIILCTVIILVGIIIYLVFFHEKDSYKINISQYNEIKVKLNNKEDLLIYITDKENNCYECVNGDKIINYYKEVYNLDFYTYMISDNTEEDLEKLKDEFDFEENFLMTPTVILIKEGQIVAVANFVLIDDILKNYLIQFGFLDKTTNEKDIPLNLETFDPIYQKDEYSLIVSFNAQDESYDFRKKILELSNEYQFKFYTLFRGIGNTNSIYDNLKESSGIEFETPSLFIVKNNTVIDYLKSEEEPEILSFLRKYNLIK